MNNKMLKYLPVVGVFSGMILALSACGGNANLEMSVEKRVMCGAYSNWVLPIPAETLAIFSAATSGTQYERCVPVRVVSQVVAGMNYRFDCEDKIITIFQPLPGRGRPEITAVENLEK